MNVQQADDFKDAIRKDSDLKKELLDDFARLIEENKQIRDEFFKLAVEKVNIDSELREACSHLLGSLLKYSDKQYYIEYKPTGAGKDAGRFLYKHGFVDSNDLLTEAGRKLLEEKFE